MSSLFNKRAASFGRINGSFIAKSIFNITIISTIGLLSFACNTNIFKSENASQPASDQQIVDELTLHSRTMTASSSAYAEPMTTSDYYYKGTIEKVYDPARLGQKSDFVYIRCSRGELKFSKTRSTPGTLWVKAIKKNIKVDRLKAGNRIEVIQSRKLDPEVKNLDHPFFYAPKQVQIVTTI